MTLAPKRLAMLSAPEASRSLNDQVGLRDLSLIQTSPRPRLGASSSGVSPSPRLTASPAAAGRKASHRHIDRGRRCRSLRPSLGARTCVIGDGEIGRSTGGTAGRTIVGETIDRISGAAPNADQRTGRRHFAAYRVSGGTSNRPMPRCGKIRQENCDGTGSSRRLVRDRQAERIAARRSREGRRRQRLFGIVVSRIARLRIDVAGGLPLVQVEQAHDRQLDRQHLCARFLHGQARPDFAERLVRRPLHPGPGRQPHPHGRGRARPSLRQAHPGHAGLSRRHQQGRSGWRGAARRGRGARPQDAGAQRREIARRCSV